MKYKLALSTSIATLILGLTTSIIYKNSLLAGISIAAAFLLYKKAEKISNIEGKTDKRKILNALASNLTEFAGLAATTTFISHPTTLIAATAAIGLSNSFYTETTQKTSHRTQPLIQRKERITILTMTLVTAYFTPFTQFYGLIILTTLVTADLILSLLKLLRK